VSSEPATSVSNCCRYPATTRVAAHQLQSGMQPCCSSTCLSLQASVIRGNLGAQEDILVIKRKFSWGQQTSGCSATSENTESPIQGQSAQSSS
jgi:hypothetical protein